MDSAGDEILFAARTPLGFTVRVTRERWRLISMLKHPVMAGREAAVQAGLLITAYPTDAIKEGTKIWPA